MIFPLTSIKVVIAKIIRDLGLNQSNDEIPVNDFIEWCAEALLHVGSYTQMKEKVAEIDISDHKGKLPCDFYSMKSICGGNYYGEYYNSSIVSEECSTSSTPYTGNYYGYNINFDTITTGYRYGTMMIQYLAMPVDEEGAPMVPDNQSFRDLLFWKVVYQLAIRGYNFTNPQLKDMHVSRQKLNFYTLQARGEANMPDVTNQARISSMFKSWGSGLPGYYLNDVTWNSGHF
jgi:hypothetical protein